MEKELNLRQLMFCKEYIIDFNGTQAAIRAGYSKKTANEQASRMLANVNIQDQIQKESNKREVKVERTAEDVVRALWEMAELDINHFMVVDEGGAIQAIPLDQIPPEKRKYINKIKGKRTIRESADGSMSTMVDETEYFIPEKKGVYELLARHHGLLIDKHEIKAEGLEDALRKINER
jgi:phage terminase small subunit